MFLGDKKVQPHINVYGWTLLLSSSYVKIPISPSAGRKKGGTPARSYQQL